MNRKQNKQNAYKWNLVELTHFWEKLEDLQLYTHETMKIYTSNM